MMISIMYMLVTVIIVNLTNAETTTAAQQLLEPSTISPESISKSATVGTSSNIILSSMKSHNGVINSVLHLNNNIQSDSKDLVNPNIEGDDMETAESSIVYMPLFASRRKAEKRKAAAEKRKSNSNSSPVNSAPNAEKQHKTTFYYAPPYYYSDNYYNPSYSNYPAYSNNYPSYSNNYPSYPTAYSSYPTYSNGYERYPSYSQYPTYYQNTPTYVVYPNYYS